MMPDANNTQQKVQDYSKAANAKRGKRNKTITIVYANEMPTGMFEKALANIFAVKIQNGNLDICDN